MASIIFYKNDKFFWFSVLIIYAYQYFLHIYQIYQILLL